MKTLRQALVPLFANGVLLFFVFELNSLLSPLAIHLTAGGILVVFPALRIPLAAGFPVALASGALWDAATPGPSGLLFFATGILYVALHRLRQRFRTRRTFYLAVVATAANGALLLFLGAWFLPQGHWGAYGTRFLLESACSGILVFALAFWFFDLQERGLGLLGAQPSADEMA
ncbi:MAG: hypothetical protein ACLFRP_10205 [Puniceicoccaceae bacterium]